MKYSDIFLKSSAHFTSDPLYDFISNYTFKLNLSGHQHDNPAATCGDRIIGDFELIYLVGGASRICIENREYVCGGGDMIFIPPFVKHSIQTSPEHPHDNYWIHFDVDPFYRHHHFIAAMLSSGGHRMQIGLSQEMSFLYCLLEKETALEQPGHKVFCNTLLTQIITSVLRQADPNLSELSSNPSKSSSEKNIVDRSIEYIYSHLSQNISIAELCAYLHISESYLFKSFIKVLKLPPNRFIQLIKIKQAEQLIKTSSLTLKEVSEMLGFSSPFYLSTIFKKYYRVSPRKYLSSINV